AGGQRGVDVEPGIEADEIEDLVAVEVAGGEGEQGSAGRTAVEVRDGEHHGVARQHRHEVDVAAAERRLEGRDRERGSDAGLDRGQRGAGVRRPGGRGAHPGGDGRLAVEVRDRTVRDLAGAAEVDPQRAAVRGEIEQAVAVEV